MIRRAPARVVREARANLDAADVKLTAARDALPSVPTRVPRDRLLDFAINLRDAIGGRTSQASSVEEVNRLLKQYQQMRKLMRVAGKGKPRLDLSRIPLPAPRS